MVRKGRWTMAASWPVAETISLVACTTVGWDSRASAGDNGLYGSSSEGKSRGALLTFSSPEALWDDERRSLPEDSEPVGEYTGGWEETNIRSTSSRAPPIRAWRALRLAKVAIGRLARPEGGEEGQQQGKPGGDHFYIRDPQGQGGPGEEINWDRNGDNS
jgi:hypothetical protein